MSHQIVVRCGHCGHKWEYTGITPYAQCPVCYRSNNLRPQLGE